MRTRHLLSLLLLGMPGAALAGDPFAGQAIYQTHCQRCHGSDARGVATTPDLHRDGLMQPDFQLIQSLQNGKGIMPAYRGLLSEDDLYNAVAYLRTLP